MESITSRIRRNIRHFGIAGTARMGVLKALHARYFFTVIKVFKNEVPDPAYLDGHNDLEWRFLDESEMLDLGRDPEYPMVDEAFVQGALEKGDECYAGLDGGKVACHGWYSNKSTDRFGLLFHFRPDYIFQYAAFTHPEYRGRRLTAVRGNRARREYLARGYKGTLFLIETHNFHSLRSAHASSDIQELGNFVVLWAGPLAWIHPNRSCRERGFAMTLAGATRKPAPAAPVEDLLTGQGAGHPVNPSAWKGPAL